MGAAAAGGSLLGLAVAAKLYPALVRPAVVRRRPVAVASAAVAAVAALYLPHVLAVGGHVLGYLPGYLGQEGYSNGTRFALLQQVIPAAWCARRPWRSWRLRPCASMRYTDPRRPWDGAVVMVGVALILTSPAYPWYTEMVVALAALAGRAEWLPLGVRRLPTAIRWRGGAVLDTGTLDGYTTAAAVALIVTVARVVRGGAAPQTLAPTRNGASHGSCGATHGSCGATSTAAVAPVTAAVAPVTAAVAQAPVATLTIASAVTAPEVARAGAERAELTAGDAVLAEVMLPCLNEVAALPYVLGRLPTGYRAIVVDNGSSDGSAEIARRLGAQVVHEPRRGFGAACHAGLRAASADVVCFCDCDGSLDPAELPTVAGPVLDGAADLVLGRRRPRGIRAWPPHARIANRTARPPRPARHRRPVARSRPDACAPDASHCSHLACATAGSATRWRWCSPPAGRAGGSSETDVRYVPRTGRSKVTGTLTGTLRAVRDMRRGMESGHRMTTLIVIAKAPVPRPGQDQA